MELGQRIKQARLEAGLSQRQLCGDTITRNMLSLVESGRARPSMDTLGYLATRLGKTIGYFLEEETVISPNTRIIADARTAYTSGDPAGALAILEDYRGPDEVFDHERWLLAALCLTARAEQVLSQGKNAYALALLEKAQEAEERSVYCGDMGRKRLLLTFQAAPDRARELAEELPCPDGELLLLARGAMDGGDHGRCAALLDGVSLRDERWQLLRGQVAMAMGDYAGGADFLHRAEDAFPRVCVPLLERCYRELEDYKRAYEYACKQRA